MIEIIAQKNPGIHQHEHGIALLHNEIITRFPYIGNYEILKMPNGKPYVQELDDFHFNISHSGEWTVLAISDKEVGVDIQKIKLPRANIAKRFFTRRENLMLNSLSGNKKSAAFTRMWTLKESRVKVTDERLATCISEYETIEYDSTWAKMIKGYCVQSIDFHDKEYILSCAYPSDTESNIILRVL